MTEDDFEKLKKLLTLATSDNDHEAAQSFRAATRILTQNGLTWEMFLSRRVTVVNAVTPAPDDEFDQELSAALDIAIKRSRGQLLTRLTEIKERYGRQGFLSPAQREIVFNAAYG